MKGTCGTLGWVDLESSCHRESVTSKNKKCNALRGVLAAKIVYSTDLFHFLRTDASLTYPRSV
eukprot:scaffold10871_cov177-Cylindrotheca_fusiformis.AAC.8